MKVRSALATLDIGIGVVRRQGNNLVLQSRAGSSLETEITVSAAEVFQTIGRILVTPAGLLFVLGLPYFWLRQRLGRGDSLSTNDRNTQNDINKPW